MKRIILSLALLGIAALPLSAQTQASADKGLFNAGIKLRGAFHVNRSAVQGLEQLPEQENGYGAGIEINGRHLGIALYGQATGQAQEFNSESTPVVVMAEANYFLPIGLFRIAPYAGVHTALGSFTKDYFKEPYTPKPQDGVAGLGYQVGLRIKPLPLISVDAQWRRQSRYAHDQQPAGVERNQVLVGVVLF